MVKQALKRRKPGFNESVLRLPLVQRAARGGRSATACSTLEHDEKSGGYIVRLAMHDE